jgi:hypothetical protein
MMRTIRKYNRQVWTVFFLLGSYFPEILHSKQPSQPQCFTLNHVLSLLKHHPGSVLLSGPFLTKLLDSQLGVTDLTTKEILQLEMLFSESAEPTGRKGNSTLERQEGVTEPIDIHFETHDEQVTLIPGQLVMKGRFTKQISPFDPEVEASYRRSVIHMPDMHSWTMPNGRAFAEYWQLTPLGKSHLKELRIVSNDPKNQSARIFKFPTLRAQKLLDIHADGVGGPPILFWLPCNIVKKASLLENIQS